MKFSFKKSERLKSKKTFEMLFSEGKSIKKFPIRVIYLQNEEYKICKAAFVVPKRNFKRAVNRNRIKRQLKEAYRLHKHLLNSNKGTTFALLFLYLGNKKLPYATIESAVINLLKQLTDETI